MQLVSYVCIIYIYVIDSTTPEIMALQKEVKSCSEQVETLQKEFKVLKKDIKSTCIEMDATRSIINEFITKALCNNQK